MKVFILTEGGKDIGLGHITRCTSIYQAFEEINIQPLLIVNGDETIRELLKNKSYRLFDWLNEQKVLFDTIENADVVFIDSYMADYDLYEKVSIIAKTAVYFDDDIRIDYPKGFVLNGAIGAEEMPYPTNEEITYLLGAKYTPLRKEFWKVPDKPIRNNIESILITFGGMDLHNLTPKVLKLLTSAYPKLIKKVIIAKSFQNITDIEEEKDNNTEMIYYPEAAEMKKAMLESDIAISACGQTLYELARTAVPTIGICVAENQRQNTEGWRKSGFLKYIGQHTDEILEGNLKNSLKYLIDRYVRERISKIGRKLIDGQGYMRIMSQLNTK